MLSALRFLALALGPAGSLAASAYQPTMSATCPSEGLVRSAHGISDAEASWLTGRKPVADTALKSWLATSLPDVNTSSLPTLALSISGGSFRSLLIGAGVVQALDGRDSQLNTSGLYQALTYQAGLSGSAWLLSALAASNWPTISSLRDQVWQKQFPDGIPGPTTFKGIKRYARVAADVAAKAETGLPVSLVDAWGRLIGYQIMSTKEGGQDVTLSGTTLLPNFQSHNVPFPIMTATKIQHDECVPAADEAIFEFNPFEFGSWSDDVSAFALTQYIGSTIANGSASECVTGFDNIDWVLGTSSMILNEKMCNPKSGSPFASSLFKIVDGIFSVDERAQAVLPNPFRAFQSTTATGPSSVADLDNLYMVDGGESASPEHSVPVLPLLEPSRSVSVLLVSDNSNNANGFPDGRAMVAAYKGTRAGRLAARFPLVPAEGDPAYQAAHFFGCNESAAVTVVYLPNQNWGSAANTPTEQVAYTADSTRAMIANGNMVATQGADSDGAWATCLACAIMLKQVGKPALPSRCTACLSQYCWSG